MQRRIIEVYFDVLGQPYNLSAIASNAYVIKKSYDSNNKAKERKRTTIHIDYGLGCRTFFK